MRYILDKISLIKCEKKHEVSPLLYGIFFEDINYAGDGGLYGELIANRSFSYYDREEKTDKHKMCWETVGNPDFFIENKLPLNETNKYYGRIMGKKNEGIRNFSYCGEGFAVKENGIYDFCMYIRAENNICLSVRILSDKGVCLSEKNIIINDSRWKKYEISLETDKQCKNSHLEIVLDEDGCFDIGYVSLFPRETFMNRKNGMRKDIAMAIKELSPKFLRFPGGCIVEGRSFSNMYNWKETIGNVEERRTNWNRWQMEEYQQEERDSSDYFQSYGIGFYEYFCFCEDIGAEPVPVLNCGMTCQWHEGLLVPFDELDKWIQDILDLIEFANGNEDTVWGKKRVIMGHKEPFNLKYIGIGNEQWGMEYFERYDKFYEVINSKYPEIKLITCAGWNSDGKEFDTAVNWMMNNKEKAYAVDEHFYKEPRWFLDNINRYDNYDRTMPKVFAGEYASHTSGHIRERKNNWYSALTEAAFLTGVEKNSDHVVMTCYAPLLAKINHQQWQPDLIWFDNDRVIKTPNYYVQKLFSENIEKIYLTSDINDMDLKVSVTGDEEKKHIIVKIVNISKYNKEICLDTDTKPYKTIFNEIVAEPDDENTYEEKVFIRKTEAADISHLVIKGFSVNVIEIELEK